MFTVRFTYADHRVKGYERYGAEKSIRKQFDTKRAAYAWMLQVEQRAESNPKVCLSQVEVLRDGKHVYHADYHREQFAWLYNHIDNSGAAVRYVA